MVVAPNSLISARNSFDQESPYTVTRRVILDDNFDPGRDIEVFLRNSFHSVSCRASLAWGRGISTDFLVQRSSGQFTYAATVLKFVNAEFYSPMKQLALVLKPDPTAFLDLDQLYT